MALTYRDYSADLVAAARSVLLELVHLLGEYRTDIVVVGGWVPQLILPAHPLKHVGSLDVDLAFNHRNLRDVGYATIQALLLSRGYEQDHRQPFISPETLLRMARKARYGYGFWTVFLAFVFGVRTKGVRNAAKMGTPPACYCLRFTAKPNTRSGCSEQMRKLHSQSARYALGTANGIPSSAAFRISSLICRWRYFSSNSLTPRSTQAWPCVSSR